MTLDPVTFIWNWRGKLQVRESAVGVAVKRRFHLTANMRGSEDLHKLTDSIYKHLTESFNPGVRNLIVCGRAYHKALTGASVMAKSYIDAISKLGHNCRANCKGATRELGEALFQVADAYRHIQLQIDEATKGLLTDFLTPLENKLENEFRIESVAHHKRYLSGHKTMLAPYEKSQRTLNKVRKKSKSKSVVDDSQFATKVTISKDKLDRFRQQGLKLALLDERKYYCYVLDKCIFMAKKYSDYHRRGYDLIASRMRDWERSTFQPDILPESSECLLEISHTGNGFGPQQVRGDYSMMYEDPYRRAHVDYMRQMPERFPPSDSFRDTTLMTRSIAVPPAPNQGILVRAVYNHSAEGESQLNFVEGDVISLLGDKSDGWHYGHNSRTNKYGWFPLSFTEPLDRGGLQMSQRFRSTGDLLDNHSVSDHGSLEQEALGLVRRPRSLYDPSQSRQTNGPSQQCFSDWTLRPVSPSIGGYSQREQTLPRPSALPSQPPSSYSTLSTPNHTPQQYESEIYSTSLYGSMASWQHQHTGPPSPPLPPPPPPPPPENPLPVVSSLRRGPSILSRSSVRLYSEPPTPARSVMSVPAPPAPPLQAKPHPKSAPGTPMNTPRLKKTVSSSSNTGISQLDETSPGYSTDYQVPPAPQPTGFAQPGNSYGDLSTSHGHHSQGQHPNGGATLLSPGSPVEETSGFRLRDRPRQLHPF